jgi:hypothetical protein
VTAFSCGRKKCSPTIRSGEPENPVLLVDLVRRSTEAQVLELRFRERTDDKFCGECGKPLAGAAREPPPREPRGYTPRHLAEKILTSRAALEGERKQVEQPFAVVR